MRGDGIINRRRGGEGSSRTTEVKATLNPPRASNVDFWDLSTPSHK